MSQTPTPAGPVTSLFILYTAEASSIEPLSDTAITDMALFRPAAVRDVPSMGSTAISTLGPWPFPTSSPLNSIGALSFSPSPITTKPSKFTVPRKALMASTAAPSDSFFLPLPIKGNALIAAASVARTSSIARLRSGWSTGDSFIRSA